MNELFIENRRTHKSQPSTVRSADCEIRHYPNGVSDIDTRNEIAIQVIDRDGKSREKELINISFAGTSDVWSGTFFDLYKRLYPKQFEGEI